VEVLTLNDKLNPNKSSGLDRIGPNILKLSKDYIVQPLTTLINTSISTGIFPDLLKLASVVLSIKEEKNMIPIILDLSLYYLQCLK